MTDNDSYFICRQYATRLHIKVVYMHVMAWIQPQLLCRLVQRKTLLLVGQVICAVSAASFSFVIFLDTPMSFLCVCLALRVVNGIGSAAVDTSSFAIISR